MANVAIQGTSFTATDLVGPGATTNVSINNANTIFTMTFSDGTVGTWTGSFIYDASGELTGGNVSQFQLTNFKGVAGAEVNITGLSASPLATVDQVGSGDLSGIVQIYLAGDDLFAYDAPTPTSPQASQLNQHGFDGNDTLNGSLADQTLIGGNGSDLVLGEGGADVLYGGEGLSSPNDSADSIFGGNGADLIYGNGGADTIIGGDALIDADDGNDTIYAGVGDDFVTGNSGNDHIYGGPGADTLHGGVGDDVFYFGTDPSYSVIGLFEGAGVTGGDTLTFITNINSSGMTTAQQFVDTMVTDGTHAFISTGTDSGVLVLYGAGLTAGDISLVDSF